MVYNGLCVELSQGCPGWTFRLLIRFNDVSPCLLYIYLCPPPTPSLLFCITMPYCLGLQTAADAFRSIGLATQFTLAVVIFLIIVTITSALQKDEVDAPPSLPGSSLFAITPFFRRRYDFLNWGFHATGHNIFKFNLLRVSAYFLFSFHCLNDHGS